MGYSVRSSQQGATQGIRNNRSPLLSTSPAELYSILKHIMLARKHARLRYLRGHPIYGSRMRSEHNWSDIAIDIDLICAKKPYLMFSLDQSATRRAASCTPRAVCDTPLSPDFLCIFIQPAIPAPVRRKHLCVPI